jgi:hypothetical protein
LSSDRATSRICTRTVLALDEARSIGDPRCLPYK